MKRFGKNVRGLFLRLLPAPECHLCHHKFELTQTAKPRLWCNKCFEHLLDEQAALCPRCGLPSKNAPNICTKCLASPPPWDRLYCISDYQSPLKSYIQQFKHQRAFWLAPNLAALLAHKIPQIAPILIPVPLHWRRLGWRGFNQSEYLATALRKHFICHHSQKSHLCNKLVMRQAATASQQGLNLKQRQINLKQAFRLTQPIAFKHVAI
ncbi:MAG: ComF family protein, partial [Vibrio sp.]